MESYQFSNFVKENIKKFSNEYREIMFTVNRAQAYKWSGDQEEVKKIILDKDWSAKSIEFRLAREVLMDDFEKANQLVREIGSNGKVTAEDYREWPLFREYRKSEGFLKVFHEVFSEPFSIEKIETVSSEAFKEFEITQVDTNLVQENVDPLMN